MDCIHCHANIPDESSFCPSCGKKIIGVSQFCKTCGTEITPEQQYCAKCGTAVTPLGTPSSASKDEGARASIPTIGMPQAPKSTASSTTATQESGRKGNSPLLLWVVFGLLFAVFGVLYLLGSTNLASWVVLVICLVLLFVFREKLLKAGVPLLGGIWIVLAIVFFLTLGFTAPSTVSVTNASNDKPANGSVNTNGKATSAPATAAKSPTPTPYKYTGAPPESLRPLIAALGKPMQTANYDLTVAGDQSAAYLNLHVNGGLVNMYNLSGDTVWDATIAFYSKEEYAKRNLESQLNSSRENEKAMDESLKIAYTPISESKLGKGDDGYLFIRTNKDQPLFAWKSYVVQQGPVYFYVSTQENTQSPIIAGDGIDILLAELKKVDVNALFTAPPAQGGSATATTSAKPTATNVPAVSTVNVQNMAVGLAVGQDQKIINPTTVFKTDAPEILMSVEFLDVAKEVSVDVKWIYLGTNESISVPTEKISADQRKSYSLSKPTAGFPTGDFKVVVLIDGQEANSLNFSVK